MSFELSSLTIGSNAVLLDQDDAYTQFAFVTLDERSIVQIVIWTTENTSLSDTRMFVMSISTVTGLGMIIWEEDRIFRVRHLLRSSGLADALSTRARDDGRNSSRLKSSVPRRRSGVRCSSNGRWGSRVGGRARNYRSELDCTGRLGLARMYVLW